MQKKEPNLWLELDTIQERLDLEKRTRRKSAQQLIYPLLMEPIDGVYKKLHDIWSQSFIIYDISTPKLRQTLPGFVIKLWCDSFENNPFGEPIITLLRKEEEEFKKHLDCFFWPISEILQEAAAPQVLNYTDLFKTEVRIKSLLSNERLSKEARLDLSLCFNAYCSHQYITALENLYTKATAFQRVHAPLPDDSASSHLGPPQRTFSFESSGLSSPMPASQESDLMQMFVEKPPLHNAYEVYFGQKSFTPEGHIFQKDSLGLGIYHFYMAEKLKGIQSTAPEENWATLKFHDGYASGNIAFEAYERALKYLSHCLLMEGVTGVEFFMSKCYEGRGHLLRKRRVGDPWELGESYKKLAVKQAKKELLMATKIDGAESNQVFYQLIRVTDSHNLEEVVCWVGKWQHSAEKYADVLKWMEEVKGTQEPRFKEYEQDLSTAVAYYQEFYKEVLLLRDRRRKKILALLQEIDSLQSTRPSSSSRRQVPCEEGNGEQALSA
ncbi:MAG: hypothetical protein C0582_02875 [Alphaproteobacteria bacterium]|nr:MAG: hypothetical protein C0582_02875 [Alphaproteobacteria bacterium]